VLQPSDLLRVLPLRAQARRSMAMSNFPQLQEGPCSGALNAQGLEISSFGLNSRKSTNVSALCLDILTNLPRRHAKIHSPVKRYPCRVKPGCSWRFAEKRGRERHEATATHRSRAQGVVHYFCPHDCERNTSGAKGGLGAREDNAKRHIWVMHDGSAMAPIRIIT
jgi:hypothetical protein